MQIESLENIEEVKMSFSAKLILVAEWFDARLTWKDLSDDEFLNIPNQEIIDKIWVPIITFENTENKYRTPIDKEAQFVVKQKGPFTLSSENEMEEVAYYKGTENSLKYSRDFFLRFKCEFNLQNFPFDSQMCTILLKKPEKERQFLKYNPTKLDYFGPIGMAEFVITGYDMIADPKNMRADIIIRIFIKRRISKHLLSTYLPSLCIMTIAQVLGRHIYPNLEFEAVLK